MAGEWLYQRDPKFLNLIQWWGPTPTDILGRECDTPPLPISESVEFGGHTWLRNKKITIEHNNNTLKVTVAKEPPIGTVGCRLFELSEAALTTGRRPVMDYDASAILDWQDWALTQSNLSMLGYVLEFSRYYLPSKLYSHHTIYRRCPYAYRGSSCGYTGSAMFDVSNQDTTDSTQDRCNKSISACSIRFQTVNQIPRFGGLDIVGPNPVGTVHTIPEGRPRTYMVGLVGDFLSVLDLSDGSAKRVGSVVGFNVEETQPQGLASLENNLYLVGDDQNALFQLNLKTGGARRIGEAEDFGIGLYAAHGIATIDDNIMYLAGVRQSSPNNSFGLYTVDIETGVAQLVGTDGSWIGTGLASIGQVLYTVGRARTSGASQLRTVNRTTGLTTKIGDSLFFGVGEQNPQAIMSLGNKLYMLGTQRLDGRDSALYELDVNTGEATTIGNAPSFGIGEGVPTGIAFIPLAPEPDLFDPRFIPLPGPDPDPEPEAKTIVGKSITYSSGESGVFVIPDAFSEDGGLTIVLKGGGGGGGSYEGFGSLRGGAEGSTGRGGKAGGDSTVNEYFANGGAGGGGGVVWWFLENQICPPNLEFRAEEGQSNDDGLGGHGRVMTIGTFPGISCGWNAPTAAQYADGGNTNIPGGTPGVQGEQRGSKDGVQPSTNSGGGDNSDQERKGGDVQPLTDLSNYQTNDSIVALASTGGQGASGTLSLSPSKGDRFAYSVGRGGKGGSGTTSDGGKGSIKFIWNEEV